MIIWVQLNVILIVIFRQRKRKNTGPRMAERKGLGIHSFGVASQIQRWPDLAFVAPPLAANEEVLTGEDFVNKGVFIGRARGTNAHGFEVGDSDRNEVAVEAENNAT